MVEKAIGRHGDSAIALRHSADKLNELQDAERRLKAIPAVYRMEDYRTSDEA